MAYTANWFGIPIPREESSDNKNSNRIRLKKVTEQMDSKVLPIQRSEKLTIEIMGVMVNSHKDMFRETNDLFVGSSYIYRNGEPKIHKVHFLRSGIKVGKWQGDFDDNIIISKREFKDNDIKLDIKVYDIDEFFGESFYTSLDEISRVLFAFPSLLPYAAPTQITVGLLPRVLKVLNRLERHDMIIKQQIRFHICEPNNWLPILQPGYFVCFQQEIEGTKLYLREDFHIVDEDWQELKDIDYAVLRIDRKLINNYKNLEITQKMAKLAAELQGKGESGKGALEFLQGTLETYTRFKHFERYIELKKNEKRGRLNSVERQLLKELKEILKNDNIFRELVDTNSL